MSDSPGAVDVPMSPDPSGSPSAAVGGPGSLPITAPPPAPLSPSGDRNEQEEPQQRSAPYKSTLANAFGDDDDDDENATTTEVRPSAAIADEEEDEDEDEEERRRRRRRREAMDDQEYEASQRRKKQRKAEEGEEAEAEDVDATFDNGLPEISDKERAQKDLFDRIDAAAKGGRKKIKRRKKGDEEDLDPQADLEVNELRLAMLNAADDDIIANDERRPALAKLRMLPRVVDGLQKSHWHQSIFDSNLLEAVRRFLEPLPDKSLPALNIQRELFSALEKLSPAIDTISLKMSGLGKIVMFYSRNKRVENDLRRRADRLIETWSRPILKRSSSYRAVDVRKAAYISGSSQMSASALAQAQAQSQSQPERRNVSIPQPVMGGFKVAPRSLLDSSGGDGGSAGGDERFQASLASRDRINAFKRKFKEAKRQ